MGCFPWNVVPLCVAFPAPDARVLRVHVFLSLRVQIVVAVAQLLRADGVAQQRYVYPARAVRVLRGLAASSPRVQLAAVGAQPLCADDVIQLDDELALSVGPAADVRTRVLLPLVAFAPAQLSANA